MTGKSSRSATGPMPWRDFVAGFRAATQLIAEHASRPDERLWLRTPSPARGAGEEPLELVVRAVEELFGPDYPHRDSFVYRFFALVEHVSRGEVDAWLLRDEEDPGEFTLHPALLLAAAEVKLTRNGRFPLRRLLARTEEIHRTEGEG